MKRSLRGDCHTSLKYCVGAAVIFISVILPLAAFAQDVLLHSSWQFRRADTGVWYQASVPGTIHTDLLAAGLIPDPYYGDNESKVQWVEAVDWEYQCTFSLPAILRNKPNIYLQFDGLDTRAEVSLNNKLILQADNMFRQWVIPVRHLLKVNGNTLRIRFRSTAAFAKAKKAAETIPYPDNERIYARKAQYQFGWDWGPRLVTAGIWHAVHLRADLPKIFPSPKAVGVQLVTTNDAAGQSFYFKKDGKPFYIKGANWIPLDNFIPRAVRQRRYQQILQAAKDAGINMLRVWGGGIYEDDIFYDLCDRLGIMVWQDFMFAGAMYPGDSSFLNNVAAEVRYQVGRLRHHPCIALWCGNNEIDEAWHNWGWQKALNYSAADSARLWSDYLKLFHHIIPDILKEMDPQRLYWPSSPSAGWGRPEAYTQGDVHYWGVWWGREPVSSYKQKIGRFNSEYGMQAFPRLATIKEFSKEKDWDTGSSVMKTHQKHPLGFENIDLYISQRFPSPRNFKDLVYLSGLMQADAVGTAIAAHRSAKPYNMGTMYWQLNDCWPVVSWSSIDYYGRLKPLHYRLNDLYAPIFITGDTVEGKLKVSIVSDVEIPNPATLHVSAHYLDGKVGRLFDTSIKLNVGIDAAKHVLLPIPAFLAQHAGECYYYLQLLDGIKEIGSSTFLPVNPKELKLTKPDITWQIKDNQLVLRSTAFAYGVEITTNEGIVLKDNYFNLLPGVSKIVPFQQKSGKQFSKESFRIRSLWDTYQK